MAGCGKKDNEAISKYKEEMTAFYDKLTYYNNAINEIDPNSESAKSDLLAILDEMNEAYKAMSELEIPQEFSGIADIATETADYMAMANEYYHYAYDNEFDADNEQLAAQYYERANSRVNIMLQVLHGQTPSGDGVTVTTQDAIQFSTVGSSTD